MIKKVIVVRHGYQVNKGIEVEDVLKLFNKFLKIIGVPRRIKKIKKLKRDAYGSIQK